MGKKITRVLLLALLLMGAVGFAGCDHEHTCADTTMGCPNDGDPPTPPPGCEDTTTGCHAT